MADAVGNSMKRPQFHFPKVNLHSLEFQTSAELFLGAVGVAVFLRWLM